MSKEEKKKISIDLTLDDDDAKNAQPRSKKAKTELSQVLRNQLEEVLDPSVLEKFLRRGPQALWSLILPYLMVIDTGSFAKTSKSLSEMLVGADVSLGTILVKFERFSMASVYIDFRSQCFLSSTTSEDPSCSHSLTAIMKAYAIPFCYTRELTISENPAWTSCKAGRDFLVDMLRKDLDFNMFITVHKAKRPSEKRLYQHLESLTLRLDDEYENDDAADPIGGHQWPSTVAHSRLQTLRLEANYGINFTWHATASIWDTIQRLELSFPSIFSIPKGVTTGLVELKLDGVSDGDGILYAAGGTFWDMIGEQAPALQILWLFNQHSILEPDNGFLNWLRRKQTTQRYLTELVFVNHLLFNDAVSDRLLLEDEDAKERWDVAAEERRLESLRYSEILHSLAGCTQLLRLEFCLPWDKVHANGMTMGKLFAALHKLQVLRMGHSEGIQSTHDHDLIHAAARWLPALWILQADAYRAQIPKGDQSIFESKQVQALFQRLGILPFAFNSDMFKDDAKCLRLFPNLRWLATADTSLYHTPEIYHGSQYGSELIQTLPHLSGRALEGCICPAWGVPKTRRNLQGNANWCITLSDSLFTTLQQHHQLRHIYLEGDGEFKARAVQDLASSCSQLRTLTILCGTLLQYKEPLYKDPFGDALGPEAKRQRLDIDIDTIVHILDKCPVLRWLSFGTLEEERRDCRILIGQTRIAAKKANSLWSQPSSIPCIDWPMSRRTCIQFITADSRSYCNAPGAYTFPLWIGATPFANLEEDWDNGVPVRPEQTGFRLYTTRYDT
jgi:hypothetical protein